MSHTKDLLNTQQYKLCIKGKVEQSMERSSALLNTSVLQRLQKEPSGRSRLPLPALLLQINLVTTLYIYIYIIFRHGILSLVVFSQQQTSPLEMIISRFLAKLFDCGRRTLRFFCPTSGEAHR